MPELSGLKILIIEDVQELVSYHLKWMRLQNIDTIYSLNGVDGLKLLQEHPDTDLVILDLKLPDMPGNEVFDKLREISPELPVIISSGYENMLGDFHDAHKVAILNKPFYQPALEEIIAGLTGRK